MSAVPELEISSCSLDTVAGGGVANRGVRGGAKLVLAKPELLDSWPGEHPSIWVKNKEVCLKANISDENQSVKLFSKVCVTVTTSDSWVCVARLPLDMREEEFTGLVASYGRVAGAFLVTSEVRQYFIFSIKSHKIFAGDGPKQRLWDGEVQLQSGCCTG